MKRFSLVLLGAVGAFLVLTPAQAADYRVIQYNDTKICQVLRYGLAVQAHFVELHGSDEKIAADLRRRGRRRRARRRCEGQLHVLAVIKTPRHNPPHHPDGEVVSLSGRVDLVSWPPPSATGEIMTKRISVIGAGTIGASWAAYFLARGFEVAAYDPAPNGEDFARRFIDNAWPTLEKLNAVQSGADRKRFSFFKDPAAAAKGAAFVQESGPEREDVKIELFAAIDGCRAAGLGDRLELVGPAHQPRDGQVQTSRTLRDRPSVQPAAPHSAGRGGRRREDIAGRGDESDELSTARSASTRSTSKRKCAATPPTGCRWHCGARRSISSSRASSRSPTLTRRSPMVLACAGR